MKNNPVRHKTRNTFKFQSFSDRVSNIRINKYPYEENDDEVDKSCHFACCLSNLTFDNNFIPEFSELSKKLPSDIALPQLLVRSDEIAGILIDHLKNCGPDSLKPALELIVALAKDLRKDFFPHFCPHVLRVCIDLSNTREVEQIDSVFTCLAHLFKYLRVSIIRNINKVLPELLPLLSSNKPLYINNFAAESFAYVARKVIDKTEFLRLCLKNIKNNQETLTGIARLYFEVVKNVSHQFYSGAEETIAVLLRELRCRKWSTIVYTICDHFVTHLISFVSAETDVSPLWKSLMAVAEEFRSLWLKENVNENAENLTLLLKLIRRFLKSSTVILRNPDTLMNFVFKISVDENTTTFPELHCVVIEIMSQLLATENFSSKIANCEDIIVKVFCNIKNESFAIRLSENLISVPKYESRAFREILGFIETHTLSDKLIEFLAKVVWMKTGFDFRKIEKLEFYVTGLERYFSEALKNTIVNRISVPLTYEVIELILQAVLIAYNLKNRTITKEVDALLKNLCSQIDSCDRTENVAKLLYILLILFESRIQYDKKTPLNYQKKLMTLAMKFVDSSNYLCSLRILDSLSSVDDGRLENCRNVETAFECMSNQPTKLINNLCSPFHKVRISTLNILRKLNVHPIFENMYLIESISSSVTTDREKLHKLQKLEFNEIFANEVKTEFLRTAVFKFLVGNLYINYLKIWEPVQKLIVSHLEGDVNSWIVLEKLLLDSVASDIDSEKLMQNFHVDFHCDYLREHFYELNGVDDRPDFYNFRCLLLGVLTSCKSMGFRNHSFLPELFLKFYKSEYAVNVHDFKSSCNIKKLSTDESEMAAEMETDESKNKKNLNRVFVILLKLINATSHQTPQKYREELENIHLEILSNGNSDVQQAAVTYIAKKRKIGHYKDRLLSLIKENSFKNELLNIRIDLNAEVIPERDWDDLMNIILRILFEKIRRKSTTHLRDAAFEFLADCGDKYVMKFFDMLFKQFGSYVQSSIDPLSYFFKETDLENTLPPYCLLTYVNTALDLQKRCGKRLSGACLSYLLKVIFGIAASAVILSNARSEIHNGYYGVLSKIRVVSFEAIMFFIENFEYEWSENEIKALVQYFIEPWIGKVANECLQSPNPTMKLFIVFSKNPRYFPLLAHKCDQLTPLDALMSLLNSEKVYFNVKNLVLEVIEQLLTQEMEGGDVVSDLMHMDNSTGDELKGLCQYGTVLLLGHISTILLYLEKTLEKKYIKLGGLYMLILKRISEMELEEDASVTLLNLLMPALRSKASADEDVVIPLLDTIFNLFKQFKNYDLFEGYMLQIAYLFGIATAPPVRRMLRDIVKYIGEKTGTSYVNTDFVYGLNVFDPRFLDQPDYAARLETYKCINEASEKSELNFYTGIFVIYNAFYTFKNERDMALRDHSGLCLRRICPILARKYTKSSTEFSVLLNDTLLPLIKDGIEDQNESYQCESVALLGHMARECPTLHPVFKNLYPLTDVSDLDNDFFENIQHLQMHRKTKALKKFVEVMSLVMRPPQPYSLMFLYPLVTRHLLNEKTASETALIHASIEALKIICRLSPWLHYERILKQYVAEMRKNVALRKQAIRIISAVLDTFHFDVSSATNVDEVKKSSAVEAMDVDDCNDRAEETLQPAVKRTTVLCRSDAERVYKSIKSFLVPSLDRIFMMYDDSEQYHKLSKKGTRHDKEEMAVLSIPIAYATVKLLKRLPGAVLDQYINTVFLKLSTYLKSRLLSIRLVARETMQHILTELGPPYFPRLLSEMMSILTKGFQLHVLVFTCHAILEKMQSQFAAGHMDMCEDAIMDICIVDLFGKLAEEKEVVQISRKTVEAKGNKSYNMLSIMAEYISENRLVNMVKPLKEILAEYMSSKVVGKVSRCLKYIALGLTRNRFLSANSLLEFAFSVSNDYIPSLVMERENNKVRIDNARDVEKADCYIIPEEPRHLTIEKRKVCCRTNAHVMIEFGLELLESMLKRGIVKSADYRSRLDPFIPFITDCLQAEHNKLVILSLKSLKYLLRRDLSTLSANMPTICESVFTILSKYSSTAVSGENGELIMSAAKVALVLVRDSKYTINNDQLGILFYVIEDLQKNRSHYGTGFALLRAILTHELNSGELHKLMEKTRQLSITAYSDSVRLMARKAYYFYLVQSPQKPKKLHDKIEFYAAQLKYEEVSGRKSALEMLMVIASAFPEEELKKLAPLLFFKLACRLIEDDNDECKKMASNCIAVILKRTHDTKEYEDLFDTTMNWLNEKKVQCRILAIQLLELFVADKGEKFEPKLDDVLPVIENQLYSGRVDGIGKHVKAPSQNKDPKTDTDVLVFYVLQWYKGLLELCPRILLDKKYENYIQRMANNCQSFLKHSHEWVRLGASQILGLIFKSLDVHQVAYVVSKPSMVDQAGFLLDGQARKQVKSLCQDFCDQLVPGCDIMEQLLKQSMKNLLFFAEVLQNVPCREMKRLSLPWLVNKLANKVRKEVAHAPRSFTVRTMVFNWLASLAVRLEADKLTSLLPIVLLPILRELSIVDDQGIEIRRVAKAVLKYYRKRVDADAYDKVIVAVQRKLDSNRAKRKMKITQMPVINPERAARRKAKIREKKKESRKRRLERLRKRKFKSKKPKAVEIPE